MLWETLSHKMLCRAVLYILGMVVHSRTLNERGEGALHYVQIKLKKENLRL